MMNYKPMFDLTMIRAVLGLICLTGLNQASGQSAGTPSASVATAAVGQSRAAYLTRGDQVQTRYDTYRLDLERFYRKVGPVFDSAAPDLKSKLLPPADIPFGYQILPAILADPANQAKQDRIRLSPFSWSRTDSIISREADSLVLLEARFNKTQTHPSNEQHAEYAAVADQYRQLVYGQRWIADLIQYNRLWQSEIARLPAAYTNARRLQDAAMARQAILDTLARTILPPSGIQKARLDFLNAMIDSAIKKAATPSYARVTHPSEHQWIVTVSIYTDIIDSAFLEQARNAIETGWHVQDNGDDFTVKLDVRQISPATLYTSAVPAKGEHIDIAKHVDRFPTDGAVLTTGSNSTYVLGRAILLGPHALLRRTLVHEFSHILGFMDGYFRSFRDQGNDGYQVLEVILPPETIVAAPENGRATRQHFDQILRETIH